MPDNDFQKFLQAGATTLDDVVAEAVGKHLTRQRGDGHTGRLALEDVAKVLKVGIAATDGRRAQLEGGDIGSADYLVIGVHRTAHAMGARVSDLMTKFVRVRGNATL